MAGAVCPRCRAPVALGANFCAACGQDLRQPITPPPVAPLQPVAPRCWNCGGVYFHYFPNGRATCYTCKQIYGWTYTPYGQIMLMPKPGFL
jgi:hypothetical protein